MTYTIQSAKYANAENTSAVLQTAEAGAVLVSETDRPELWAALLAWGTPEAYEAPAPAVRVATARQFKAALAIANIIDPADVTSAELPANVVAALAQAPVQLSDNELIIARSTWANMAVVPENDPLLAVMRQALNKTEAELAVVFDIALGIP